MILSIPPEVFLFSLVGGIIPALIWLLFWLREDKRRPEPRGLIMLAFLGGILAVPLVVPFQQQTQFTDSQFLKFLSWASIEEIFKFGVAFIIALRLKEDNEPIDPIIYMMTVALGFSAFENVIFIFNEICPKVVDTLITNTVSDFTRCIPVFKNYVQGSMTGNFRFIGASLLHTISSATIGIAMGLSFYKEKVEKIIYIIVGLIIAIALHTTFNLFIIKENSGTTFATLGFVWIAIVVLMLFFERVKKVYAVNKI